MSCIPVLPPTSLYRVLLLKIRSSGSLGARAERCTEASPLQRFSTFTPYLPPPMLQLLYKYRAMETRAQPIHLYCIPSA